MKDKISVVINTLDAQANIARAIKSVKWSDEVLVCDMDSTDETISIAKKSGAKIIKHKREEYVELARNFAISKAANEWILILDPDEEIGKNLAKRLQAIAAKMEQISFVRIPRKNIIFGKWMKTSGWWPDYNIRFFRKGKVSWEGIKIHRPPETSGEGIDLEAKEEWAIIHYNYQSIFQFIDRMNRYTSIEAGQKVKEGYRFDWRDLLRKPLNEFLSRFFASKGYEDGLHGLALSLLQSVSFLVVYLKVWQLQGFKEDKILLSELDQEKKDANFAINWWIKQVMKTGNPVKDLWQKLIH